MLSEYEVTKYSKNPNGSYYGDETRQKEITDFATANNANKVLRTYGGWWLRTPKHNKTNEARSVDNYGDAGNYSKQVTSTYITVVPALSISF